MILVIKKLSAKILSSLNAKYFDTLKIAIARKKISVIACDLLNEFNLLFFKSFIKLFMTIYDFMSSGPKESQK